VTMQQHYFHGTGRRKTSVARCRLYPGTGTIIVNGKAMEDVFPRPSHQAIITQPLRLTGQAGRFNVQIVASGGGVTGWAGAISHGVSRALILADEALKPTLRKAGLLTRDARMKERKKYGLKRARKAPQYTKR
jgi:small subunit ribosomal protein S9